MKDKEKIAKCIIEKSNWGVLKPEHKFDHARFDPALTKKNLAGASPKLKTLLDKIKELDEQDMKQHGKLFKHFIYSDIKSSYGAKLIASGLAAAGYKHAYELKQTSRGMSFTLNKFDGKSSTFATLTSVNFFEKPIGINFRKELLGAFNKRPDNNHGQNIRIIILDSGFREGIDLFDIKYVHLFEPIITKSDEKQAIGRATRFCGQKGLRFDPVAGWPLQVFRYETVIPKEIKNHLISSNPDYSADSFFELFLKFTNIDKKKITFANELEKVTVETAVDKYLTQEIHEFKVPQLTGGRSEETKVEKEQKFVATKYKEFKWAKVKVENTCGTAGGASASGGAPMALSFTPTQEFVRRYFTPRYPHPGMLLWHSVGTGKLCTAISTLTTTFEPEDYTILYVTRYTLKGEVWKNVFDQTCSLIIQDMLKQGKTLPEAQAAKLRLLSKGWFEPMSYRQLSNLIAGKNKLTDKLLELNGKADPLRKTVIVIDEAHKLFAADVEGQEKADMDVLREAFMHSNRVSGKDGVKLLFMTATPYTSEPMDLMRLLNLLRPAGDQLPEIFEEFAKEYLDDNGAFTEAGKQKYHNQIAGYISYLNREKDIRSFAYPVIKDIQAPMSKYEYIDALNEYINVKGEYEFNASFLYKNKNLVQQDAYVYKKELEQDLQDRLANKRKEHKECLENIELNIKKYKEEISKTYDEALKTCKETAQEKIQVIKDEYKSIIQTVRDNLKIESKGKPKEEKALLKEKAKTQIESLKMDQQFDTEQVYLNIEYLNCQSMAEEVYRNALLNTPTITTKEQCNALLKVIQNIENDERKIHEEMVKEFIEEKLEQLKLDEERLNRTRERLIKLEAEKIKQMDADISQLTGLEKCLAPKVKPLYDKIIKGEYIEDPSEEDGTPDVEEVDENVKSNIYLVSGHGGEEVVRFNNRKKMPDDKVLVVFPVCSRPNFMDNICTFIRYMNDPANKKFMRNPIKYKNEITRAIGMPIRVYLPGEYVPDLSTNLFLDYQKNNKVVFVKSGVYRLHALKDMDRTILDTPSHGNELGAPLCKPIIGQINTPSDYTKKVHKEVFRGNVFKPASNYGTYNSLRYRNFTLDNILKETGTGIYYYIGCRCASKDVSPEEYAKVIEKSEEQQKLSKRVKKIEPVLPYLKGSVASAPSTPKVTSSASSKSTSDEKQKKKKKKPSVVNTKEEKAQLVAIAAEVKDTFATLKDVATKVDAWREKLEGMAQTDKVKLLLEQLIILEKLNEIKDTAKPILKVNTEGRFYHLQHASILQLEAKKYTFNYQTYGFLPKEMRAVEEKCSASALVKKVTSLYKKNKLLDLPQEPTEDKETFLNICKQVKLI